MNTRTSDHNIEFNVKHYTYTLVHFEAYSSRFNVRVNKLYYTFIILSITEKHRFYRLTEYVENRHTD